MTLREPTPAFPAHERTDSAVSDSDARTVTGTTGDCDPKRQSTVDPQYACLPKYIPLATGEGRMLVLCFDGTGNRFDENNTNIVELFGLLRRDDPSQQVVYYQTGIGTTNSSHSHNPILKRLSEIIDVGVAWDLDAHIKDGYKFVMQNYRPNDKICIFGFSRGAYSAKCVAGMLDKIGLLPAANVHQVHQAYTFFEESHSKQNSTTCHLFKSMFCIDVSIHFLGVWDTVASVGIISSRRLPFSTMNPIVRTFRHAISLDEHRARFQVKTWPTPNAHEETLNVPDEEIPLMTQSAKEPVNANLTRRLNGMGKVGNTVETELEAFRELDTAYSVERRRTTDVKEVWFAGVHTDVGGSDVKNGVRPNLAHIPLRWMIREIFRTDTGIIFNSDSFARLGLDPNTFYPVVQERADVIPVSPSDPSISTQEKLKGPVVPDTYEMSTRSQALLAESGEECDKQDALAPIHDTLARSIAWWILEVIPMQYEEVDKSGAQHLVWRPWNLGRGREIPGSLPNDRYMVHWTVKTRLEATFADGTKYVPLRPVPNLQIIPQLPIISVYKHTAMHSPY